MGSRDEVGVYSQDQCGQPTVSVVIPTLNEAANLPYVLERLPEIDELIVVDGGSNDGTVDVVRTHYPNAVVVHQDKQGKGNALACGFAIASGDILVTLDGDGSMDPAEIPTLVSAILESGADFAKGSRTIESGGSEDLTKIRRAGNWILRGLVNLIYGTHYTDLCYGLTAFWRKNLGDLRFTTGAEGSTAGAVGDGFEIETCLNIRAARAGLQVVEVPSFERKRAHGTSNLRVIPDGIRILGAIFAEGLRRRPALAPATTHLNLLDDLGSVEPVTRPAAMPSKRGRILPVDEEVVVA